MIRKKWLARVLVFVSAISMCAPATALAEEVPAEEVTAAEISDEYENGGDSTTGYSSEEIQMESAAQDNSGAVTATGAETEATEATETSSDAVTGSEDEIEGATIAEYNAGWSYSGGKWYYYSGSGKALTGWQYLSWSGGRSWFYFDGNGAMKTGWQYLSWGGGRNWFYFDRNGAMKTGWQYLSWSGGRSWFYFDGNGAMKSGWQYLSWGGGRNWFYFNGNGAMKTGWQYLSWGGGRNWFYFDGNGAMKTGWQYLSWSGGRSWFYFDGNGAMKTGWQYLSWSGGKNWFYFNTSSGAMKTGWLTVNGKTYYLNSSGAMLTGTQTINGTRYTFGSDGALISGTGAFGTAVDRPALAGQIGQINGTTYIILGYNLGYNDGTKSYASLTGLKALPFSPAELDQIYTFTYYNGRVYYFSKRLGSDADECVIYSCKIDGSDQKRIKRLRGYLPSSYFAIENGVLYYYGNRNTVYAYNLSTGKEAAASNIPQAVSEYLNNDILYSGSYAYYRETSSGNIYRISSNGSKTKIASTDAYDGKDLIAVCGNRVYYTYAGSNAVLYYYDTSSGKSVRVASHGLAGGGNSFFPW